MNNQHISLILRVRIKELKWKVGLLDTHDKTKPNPSDEVILKKPDLSN